MKNASREPPKQTKQTNFRLAAYDWRNITSSLFTRMFVCSSQNAIYILWDARLLANHKQKQPVRSASQYWLPQADTFSTAHNQKKDSDTQRCITKSTANHQSQHKRYPVNTVSAKIKYHNRYSRKWTQTKKSSLGDAHLLAIKLLRGLKEFIWQKLHGK